MLPMKLAFVRHGPTDWNAEGRIQGHTDNPLSETGLRQMQGLRLPAEFAGARIFASPLIRAQQTAAALGLAVGALDARLMEQDWGRWEGLATGWSMDTIMPEELDVSKILILSLSPDGKPAIAELNRAFSRTA